MAIKRTTKTSTTAKKSSGKVLSNMSPAEIQGLIAKKAYEIYAQRGYYHGNDQSDWYEAEKSVRSMLR
ncbi:MAG: DUF2934 domain-containing protein [Candidatus Omnitrophica bacterium]|nr:DUF2934 domain-containing protein [Candidatus Omnitrophota bacterium]MDD4013415.1 DUF2934 domain-containing protein [Candidatus Omnitrophota bacterium]